MLYSSEGLISACGLVPSVFGREGIVIRSGQKSREIDNKDAQDAKDAKEVRVARL